MAQLLQVKTREAKGRQVRAHRRSGVLPGVVYGFGMDSVSIDINQSEFRNVYREAGTSSLIDVKLNEKESFKALIKEVQLHLLHMHPVHVDLQKINMDKEFEVDVPFHFIGESPAVKDLSGTLVRNVSEVTVRCLPANLPSELEVDLSKLVTFDDTIYMKDIILPEGVTVDIKMDIAIASVVPPLTEEQMKQMEADSQADVSTIEVAGDEKKEDEEEKGDEKKEEGKKE